MQGEEEEEEYLYLYTQQYLKMHDGEIRRINPRTVFGYFVTL
jgi:hypothetical protein